MGLDKCGCFMQMYVYYWKPYSTEHEDYVSKVIYVFQELVHVYFHIKNKYQVPITSLSLHWAIYWHKPVYIFLQDRAALLLNMQNVHSLYYLLLHLFASLCHTLYSDAAKFSIKLFSFIYFTVSVVRQRDEYKIVTETWPIKTSLHNQLFLPRC